MINNRQGNRRRGRGGQRPQNIGGRPEGNRQDNRQRGNAAQLLEKYKSLARDSQLAGDRVQTEYYLQFADHYFRVLGESRARFEEQRPQRGEEFDDDDGDEDQFDGDGDQGQDNDRQERNDRQDRSDRQDRQDRPERQERPERQDRPERQPRMDRNDRGDRPQRDRPRRYARDENGEDRPEGTENAERAPRAERTARPDRSERQQSPVREASPAETLSFDVLPPAIGITPSISEDEEVERPRRRVRRPRPASDDGEIAPAA